MTGQSKEKKGERMKVKIGHVTHTWGKRPFLEIIDEISLIGYEGVETFVCEIMQYITDTKKLLGIL